MNTRVALLTLGLAAFSAVQAGSVNRHQIAGDARWVLHLDADALRQSQIGRHFLDKILEPKSAQGKSDLRAALDFELDWRKLRSITAYGPSFLGKDDPNGVLLIETSMAVEAALKLATAKAVPNLRVRQMDSGGQAIYSLNDQGYAAVMPSGVVILGKNLATVQKAQSVVDGRVASLATGNALAGYPEMTGSFFFLALAEGFADQAPLPSNAALLKNAQGARLAVGESGDQLLASLSIRLLSAEVAQQVQQVAQGLIALASLSGGQNPHLRDLAQKAQVSSSGTLVTIRSSLPVDDAIQKLPLANP